MSKARSKFCTVLSTLALATLAPPPLEAAAAPTLTAVSDWIKVGKAPDGISDLYLGTRFSSVKGKYPAVWEKSGSPEKTVEGEFLVGEVRYTFPEPIFNGDVTVDEDIITSVLNCDRHLTGTWKIVSRLKGKIVSSKVTPASKLLMLELHERNTGTQLCELHKRMTSRPKVQSTQK